MGAELVKHVIRYVVPRSVRNWLRSPKKSTEWIWDGARFSLGVTRTLQVAPNLGVTLHPQAFKIAQQAQINDPGQSAEFKNFISHCDSKMFLFDIGAHYGLFSLVAAKFDAKAIAVDPSPVAIRMIARQVELNHARQKVRAVQAAVSDADGVLHMLSSGVFSDGYLKLVSGRAPRELTKVFATTIDRLTSEFGPPTHIKIDVEGHEQAVLSGGRDTLTRFSPQLFLELHNQMIQADGRNPGITLDQLESVGYETFSFDGTHINRSTILKESIIRVVARRRV